MVDINKQLEKQILKENQAAFSHKVEELVWMEDISYMEAINSLMKESDFEPEFVAKLLTPELKSKLTIELEDISMVKKSNRLV